MAKLCAFNKRKFPKIVSELCEYSSRTLLSQFSIIADIFIGKVLVKEKDSRVLTLVNLNPGANPIDFLRP
jgi:hypothetical protein